MYILKINFNIIIFVFFQLLERDPEKRLGCIEDRMPVRSHPFFSPIDWVKLEARESEPPFKPRVVSFVVFIINMCMYMYFLKLEIQRLLYQCYYYFRNHLVTSVILMMILHFKSPI